MGLRVSDRKGNMPDLFSKVETVVQILILFWSFCENTGFCPTISAVLWYPVFPELNAFAKVSMAVSLSQESS